MAYVLHNDLFCSAPGTPANVSVQALYCHSLNVTWSPPDETGGLPITGYNISYTDTANAVRYGFSKSVAVFLQQLNPDTKYTVRVKATNAIGGGEFAKRKRIYTTQRS